MERNTRQPRHVTALLTIAVVLAWAAGGPSNWPPAEDAPFATSDGLANGSVTAEAFGLYFDGPDRHPMPSTSTGVAVLGTEQAPATTASPTTTIPPTTLLSTTPTTSALSSTTAPPASAVSPDERGRQALARLSYDWVGRLPGWTVTFSPERSGVYGYTYVGEQRIEIFVRETQSDALLTHVIAHELGHAVDVTLNTSEDRSAWAAVRGIDGVQWWPGDGVTDFSTGAGDFAEAFAVWQAGSANYRGRVAGEPTADQLDILASLANR